MIIAASHTVFDLPDQLSSSPVKDFELISQYYSFQPSTVRFRQFVAAGTWKSHFQLFFLYNKNVARSDARNVILVVWNMCPYPLQCGSIEDHSNQWHMLTHPLAQQPVKQTSASR